MHKRTALFLHAIPALVAISLVQVVNIQVYLHSPVAHSKGLLLGWLVLQIIPGFVFWIYLRSSLSQEGVSPLSIARVGRGFFFNFLRI